MVKYWAKIVIKVSVQSWQNVNIKAKSPNPSSGSFHPALYIESMDNFTPSFSPTISKTRSQTGWLGQQPKLAVTWGWAQKCTISILKAMS